jgi:hypothetical protein
VNVWAIEEMGAILFVCGTVVHPQLEKNSRLLGRNVLNTDQRRQ